MITPLQYFKRSTIILFVSLGVVIVVAVWCKQYLAVRNSEIVIPATVGAAVVKDLPIQTLFHEQVLTLRPSQESVYTQQVVGQNTSVLSPDMPVVTVTNTQLGNSVLIRWYNPSADTSYDGIMIYRSDNSTTPGELLTMLAVTSDGSYHDTTVSANQTYYYFIQTFRTVTTSDAEPVTSALSAVYPVTVTDNIVPLPPQAVTASAAKDNPTAIVVQWTNEPTDDVAVNTIYRSKKSGVVGDALATVPANTTEWLDTTITPGEVYYYTVSASDAAGNESSTNLSVAPAGNAAPFLAGTKEAL